MPKTLYRASVTTGAGMDFVVSDGSVDRHGTRINPQGWDLSNFKANPIALFGHNSSFPIGTWSNIRTEGDKLVATLKLAARGTSDRINEIIGLVEQGILRATSVGFNVLRMGAAGKDPYDFMEQELLEVSVVSVPSNTNALSQARALNLSPETLSIVFGESANERRGTASNPGATAANPPVNMRPPAMTTLAQRIENAQNDLVTMRDRLAALTSAEQIDTDAVEALNAETARAERTLAALQETEKRIGINAGAQTAAVAPASPAAPAVNRTPLGRTWNDVKPSDLLVRAASCRILAHVSGRPIEQILEERYPGHEATAAVTRTAIAVGTTTTSGWASQLVQTATAEFLALLPPTAIYPQLRDLGVSLTFGPGSGNIKIPFSSSTTALAGGFVLEGDPIPVGRMTLDSITLTPTKFGIIVPMTKEVMRYTNPTLESVVRSELLARTAITLDGLLIDSTASSATRPAGLLNGVSAGTAYAGSDYTAFLEDMKTLLTPFDTANAGRKLAVLMNPKQLRNVRMMPGPNSSGFGWADQFMADFKLIASTVVTAGTIIAVDTADFVTSTGDTPEFEVSDQATIHMDSSPSPISATGTPNTVAAPIRSMFQTNSVALKMTMDVNWAMRRTGMVQYISGVSW
jgi:HK97 family phage prohead protease